MNLTPEQHRASVYNLLTAHVQHFFTGHAVTHHRPDAVRVYEHLPRFHVLQVAPGPKAPFWTYISHGAWEMLAPDLTAFEFTLIAPEPDDCHLRLIAMLAYYHTLDHGRLGVGHTLPIGQPWLPQSSCDQLLICHPYPYGATFEHCRTEDFTIHLLWALPITAAERAYKHTYGLEQLEERFDQAAIAYWEPQRGSVVEPE